MSAPRYSLIAPWERHLLANQLLRRRLEQIHSRSGITPGTNVIFENMAFPVRKPVLCHDKTCIMFVNIPFRKSSIFYGLSI